MARDSGATNRISRPRVMMVTATPRLPPVKRCTASISGHVASTNVIDQMIAGMNGCKIHTEPMIRPPTDITPSVVVVRSLRCSSMRARSGALPPPYRKPVYRGQRAGLGARSGASGLGGELVLRPQFEVAGIVPLMQLG